MRRKKNKPGPKTPEETRVKSGGNPLKSGVKQGKPGKNPGKGKKQGKNRVNKSSRLPAGTVSRTGQQPPADPPPAAGSGGVDPTKPIGPGNPPASGKFKPGQSGNPKGYPKGQLNTKTIIKYWLGQEEEIKNPINDEIVKVKVVDTMVLGLIARARKGDVGAFRELMDRIDGKPVQSNKLILDNKEGGQILVGFMAPRQIITKPAPPSADQSEPNND